MCLDFPLLSFIDMKYYYLFDLILHFCISLACIFNSMLPQVQGLNISSMQCIVLTCKMVHLSPSWSACFKHVRHNVLLCIIGLIVSLSCDLPLLDASYSLSWDCDG
jgi:hypothetical protein